MDNQVIVTGGLGVKNTGKEVHAVTIFKGIYRLLCSSDRTRLTWTSEELATPETVTCKNCLRNLARIPKEA